MLTLQRTALLIIFSLFATSQSFANEAFENKSFSNKEFFQNRCSNCHGTKGEGLESSFAPAISGLDVTYLKRQLSHFKQGIRGGSQQDPQGFMMAQISKSLTSGQIDSISNYLSQQDFINSPPAKSNGGFRGAGLYRNCQSCHGAKAQGSKGMGAPRLAGQNTEYLKRQITNFKDGIRGNNPDDKFGHQMALIAESLSDDSAIEAILQFISHKGK